MSVFTQTAKAALYQPNGTGRDSYIYGNNGGFTVMNEPSIQPGIGKSNSVTHIMLSIGTLISSKKAYSGVKMPVISSKTIHYQQNGSGRDTYIM